MTEQELKTLNDVKERIDELEEEIYALFEAKDRKIFLKERIIRTVSRTIKKDYRHEVTIKLSLEDINMLQSIRQQELSSLRKIIADR